MSKDKDHIIFVEGKYIDDYYVENENGYPMQIENFSEATKVAEEQATTHPGAEVKIYKHIATIQIPIGKPQVRMIK